MKVYHKILYENSRDTYLVQEKVNFPQIKHCFHLRIFPVFPCIEVTYKKSNTILGIIDISNRITDAFGAAKMHKKNGRYKIFEVFNCQVLL